jgi:hypothetical protein
VTLCALSMISLTSYFLVQVWIQRSNIHSPLSSPLYKCNIRGCDPDLFVDNQDPIQISSTQIAPTTDPLNWPWEPPFPHIASMQGIPPLHLTTANATAPFSPPPGPGETTESHSPIPGLTRSYESISSRCQECEVSQYLFRTLDLER